MSESTASARAKTFVKLGISPLSWVNEVLEDLGGGTAATTILDEAHAAGFAGVEMSRAFPSDPQALRALLEAHGMDFISGWYSGFLAERSVAEDLADVAPHAALLKTNGADVMVYGECGHMVGDALDVPLARRLTLNSDDMIAYGQRLTEFAEALKADYGLDLAYHHHLMMVAETFDEVCAVMDNTGPAVGLLLDTGHAQAGGFDYTRLIEKYADRINHIHLKDVRADVISRVRAESLSFNEGVRLGMFTVPGDGDVDFWPISQFLQGGTYQGWIVVEAEQDPAKAPPAETVARAHRFVTKNILNLATV